MSKYLISALLLVGLVTLRFGFVSNASPAPADTEAIVANDSSLLNQSPIEEAKAVSAIVTAYSSRAGETDSTPYTTAAGTKVREGIVAANWLPLGTQIKIPEIFGDRVFIVEDRMHRRNSQKVDVWFPTTNEALQFGVRWARIEVL